MANPNNYPTPQSVGAELTRISNTLDSIKKDIADAQILCNTNSAAAQAKFKNNDTKLLNYYNQLAGLSSALTSLRNKGLDTTSVKNQYDNLFTTVQSLQTTNASLQQICKQKTPVTPAATQTSSSTTGGSRTQTTQTPSTGTTREDTVTPVLPNAEPAFTNQQGLEGPVRTAVQQFTDQNAFNTAIDADWRVRITLAPNSPNILYNVPSDQAGILQPLQATNGVIFPYTPQINIVYKANYEETSLVHSNYKLLQYSGSSVEGISIVADFTAQDTQQADYLLAVIHFFRSATKMFYGQDENPKPGTPPPIVYIYGLGQFQFNAHPMVITTFNYSLPNNVHYLRSSNTTTAPGVSKYDSNHTPNADEEQDRLDRIYQGIVAGRGNNGRIAPGGGYASPMWQLDPSTTYPATYVPTAMQIQLQAFPVISRNKMSNEYSTRDYASGQLLLGREINGGFW
jgi:hypothetical protein